MAYDAVDELGRLAVRDPSLRPVPVGAAPPWDLRADAERFTGDVYLQLADNAPTAIPGVAGQQQAFVAPELPGDPVGIPDTDTDAPLVPPIVLQAADAVFHAMNTHRGEPFNRVIPRMVAYFSAFRDADLPTPRHDGPGVRCAGRTRADRNPMDAMPSLGTRS